MIRPFLVLSAAAMAVAAASPSSAGTCVTRNVPVRGDVTVCTTDRGCDVYVDPGGRTVALCIDPVDTTPLGVCTTGLPGGWRVCLLTTDCAVFVSLGYPPYVCL